MKQLAQLLKEHYDNHPDMEVRDAVKFLYQSYMGPGHLIADEQAALARFLDEWEHVAPDSGVSAADPLGNGLYRMNFSGCKAIGLSGKTAARLFLLTAKAVVPDRAGLEQALELVRTLPFAQGEVEAYLTRYRADGLPMVSHSDRYRNTYAPAYRIVSKFYVNLIPALAAIDRLMKELPHVRVALDGPCASGKSTLGEALSEIYRCPLIHMDDFFLRPEQRTPEQLAEPGGNVDYVRFRREVLEPLVEDRPAQYRPWQCRVGGFGPEQIVKPGPVTVVEGSYSLRPDLREGYHLRLWVEADWEQRERRLAARGGPGCLARFREMWIPMEDRYFSACAVKEYCHLTISGNE